MGAVIAVVISLIIIVIIVFLVKVKRVSPVEKLKDFYYQFLRIESETLRALNKEPNEQLVSLFARLESYLYQLLDVLHIRGATIGEALNSREFSIFFTPEEQKSLREFVRVAIKIRKNGYVPVKRETELLYKVTKILKQKCESAVKS